MEILANSYVRNEVCEMKCGKKPEERSTVVDEIEDVQTRARVVRERMSNLRSKIYIQEVKTWPTVKCEN